MARFCKVFVLLLLTLLAACQEGGEAGDLFGMWRMDGTDNHYLSFSGSIVLFRSVGEGDVFGTFQHKGDSLFIQCYSISGAPIDTAVVEGTFGMRPFNDIRLKVTTLDGDRLRLEKAARSWNFYQY